MKRTKKQNNNWFTVFIALAILAGILLALPVEVSYSGNMNAKIGGDLKGLLNIKEVRLDSAKASIDGGLQERITVSGPLIFFILFPTTDYQTTNHSIYSSAGGLLGKGPPGAY